MTFLPAVGYVKMSETRRVIFGGLLLSRSKPMAAVDGFCFVPALPKWVSGSGSASVAVIEPSPFLRYRHVVQRFRRWTSNTVVGARGVPLALAKLNAASSARRGTRRITAATAGGVSTASSIPPGGAPVEPGGGVIGAMSPWWTYTGWPAFGPSTWNGAAGGSPVSWRRFVPDVTSASTPSPA